MFYTCVKIAYNILDLPEKVFAGTQEVRYIYDATGAKLATVAANGSLTYYRSVFTYAATSSSAPEQLMHVLHPEGLVQREGSAWVYKYFKTDHVGSTRAVLAMRGTRIDVDQRTDFYPYGLAHGSFQNLQHNKYLYGGKEYQDQMLGSAVLGLYDFHARYYNPIYGRWFNVDPALQTTNPYLYCGNSPMMYQDEDGEWFWIIGAVVGAYFGGSASNGSFNPGKWDWSSANTWSGMLGGAIQGAASVDGIQAGLSVAGIGKSWVGMSGVKTALSTAGRSAMGAIWRGAAQGALVLYAGMKAVNILATVTSTIANSDNAGRIIMGNYYYNPRRSFFGQVWEGISRGSYEGIQQGLGSAIGHKEIHPAG